MRLSLSVVKSLGPSGLGLGRALLLMSVYDTSHSMSLIEIHICVKQHPDILSRLVSVHEH